MKSTIFMQGFPDGPVPFHYPAQDYALILWNHGTGIIDPRPYKIINPAELFTFNAESSKFELDRTIGSCARDG